MTPSLETKLARLIDHFERLEMGPGTLRHNDAMGVRHEFNDREVAEWLTKQRAKGIPLGAILHNPRGY